MDSVTQAALGAALGGAIAGRVLGRKALLTGALLGTLPDMDVVIDYGNAVANFSQHRGFSHSLFVLVPLGFLLAWAGRRWQSQMSWQRWLALTLTVLITHPLLDCLTTYGTQLFWPFGGPIALTSIFIIDPLYTLPLLLTILVALWRPRQPQALVVGLVVSTAYLGWSLVAQQLINDRVTPALAAQGAAEAPRMVQPMPLTTLLWRVTVMTDTERLEIVTGFLDDEDIPLNIERFPRNPELAAAAAGLEAGRRLIWFTDGFLAYHRFGDQLAVTDIRLGVPGAHPFTFVIAETGAGSSEWQPVASYKTDRPAMRPGLFKALWQRITGASPVLCLATLETGPVGMSCS
ncbi:MAG: metal-dependent hydrolase [Marinobacter sp.]|uniref:metal-dependent hydrolase n=1 Tax=Marinobacter sp. TaxID=50741 RepID=UPI00299E101B|nr:metal-dependent hydrolase [Marinobacter sp.]MDX1634785.1 metal-dependent hydrolase [Marinobacter sp.]